MTKLTDLEISKKIAKITNLNFVDNSENVPNSILACGKGNWFIGVFRPIEDEGMCWRFMIKFEIDLIKSEDGIYTASFGNEIKDCVRDANPNKAVCLAIIKKHEANNNE